MSSPKQHVRAHPKIRRNTPCPCKSGRKYKFCCLRAEKASIAKVRAVVLEGWDGLTSRIPLGLGRQVLAAIANRERAEAFEKATKLEDVLSMARPLPIEESENDVTHP